MVLSGPIQADLLFCGRYDPPVAGTVEGRVQRGEVQDLGLAGYVFGGLQDLAQLLGIAGVNGIIGQLVCKIDDKIEIVGIQNGFVIRLVNVIDLHAPGWLYRAFSDNGNVGIRKAVFNELPGDIPHIAQQQHFFGREGIGVDMDGPGRYEGAADILQLLAVRHADKALDQQRIEYAAHAVGDHLQGDVPGERALVASLRRNGLVGIRNGNDLRPYGDVVAFQAIRIARAVKSLMVVKAYVLRIGLYLRVQRVPGCLDQLPAKYRVFFYDVIFNGGQSPLLIQDGLGNAAFPDIMQRGCQGDFGDHLRIQVILIRNLNKLSGNHFGQGFYITDVVAALSVDDVGHFAARYLCIHK